MCHGYQIVIKTNQVTRGHTVQYKTEIYNTHEFVHVHYKYKCACTNAYDSHTSFVCWTAISHNVVEWRMSIVENTIKGFPFQTVETYDTVGLYQFAYWIGI